MKVTVTPTKKDHVNLKIQKEQTEEINIELEKSEVRQLIQNLDNSIL